MLSDDRNKDLRLTNNRALSHAVGLAKNHSLPLVVLHIFSPSDYEAHDRSARRIDFQLRQMRTVLQPALSKMDIPFYSVIWEKRKEIPGKLLDLMQEWGASHLVGNIEHEVDELRRDTEIVKKTTEARKKGCDEGWQGEVTFLADFCVVPPGEVLTKVRCLVCLVSLPSLTPIDTHTARKALLGLLALVQELV